MENAATEFLLNKLKELLLNHSHLILDKKEQIEIIEADLRLLNAFLKDSLRWRRKDEPTKVLVRGILDVVYEVEDVIDALITQFMEHEATSSFFRDREPAMDLRNIIGKVEHFRTKVEMATINFSSLSVREEDDYGQPQVRPPRQKDVVGFRDVTEELIERLTQETDYFDVVSLVGMFGLGKTTLAWKIYNDPAILSKFSVRIWLPISQDFSDRDIFLTILKEFTTTDDLHQRDAMEIAKIVADYLGRESFLIVLDDVWNPSDWDRIRVAMPENNNKGKILITSRIEDVGIYASFPRPPKKLRFFTQEESWELLQLEALRKLDCPPELYNIGQLTARDCGGLPLAIVVASGVIAEKSSASDLSKTTRAWEKLSARLSSCLNKDPRGRMQMFISLSYDSLPYHLRACFLYLAVFPEDYEIPASRLIRMWIGEGFIQQKNDRSLEECGEMYLEDLINKNLVTIHKLKPNGKVKTCRIHDTIRDFCRSEAGNENENFLQEIKSNNGSFVPPVSSLHEYRRLSIHFNCLEFIASKPFGVCVRSFVCFSKDELSLPVENIPDILAAFKLIRVLDVKPIIFPKLNSDIYQLVHMRYLALSFELSTLPSRFSQLWNIQTLVIDTTSPTLEVKADIWKLSQLRYFKTNASATLPKPSEKSIHGAELRTLGTISVESCTAELFERACNLKKLGIRGRLALLLEGEVGSFASLGKMEHLQKLKLVNDVHPTPASEGQLRNLPRPNQFPAKLSSLTLVATFLNWDFMSILGLLENLQVLKLKDNAFMGNTWKAVDGGFRHLEFLQIEDTDLAVWEASSHHFPRLRGLMLKNCEKLRRVPIELADVASLQMLELNVCISAAASAKEIRQAKMTQAEGTSFNLSIFPSID